MRFRSAARCAAGAPGGTEEFRGDGFRGGVFTALTAGGTQIGAGLLLAVGLLTPLAAAGTMGVMTVALTVKRPHGLWVQNDGFEYPLVLVTIGAVLSATGPGHWSLDASLGRTGGGHRPALGRTADLGLPRRSHRS
ncbi:DoxX family protein [Kitasatospora sp. NPDC008050]|uniref:DoxX family protein n=1 Tax=Kitasatospora sp. NPDC008050 TaxID=3364021 RepID=UPI0036E51DCE